MPDSPALAVHSTAAQLKLAGDLVNIVFWRHDLVTNRLHFDDHGFTVLGIPHCAAGLTLEESRSYTHPDDVAKLAASAAQALLTDLPVDVETRHRRSDGIWRHMLVRRVVERDAAGAAVAFVGVSLDVTERHQAATALNAASARAALIARSAGIGTWETTLDDGQAHWDAQMYRLRGLEPRPGAMSHDERVALVHADDRRYFLDARLGHQDTPRLAAYEFRVRLPDGSYRWLASRSALLRDEHGTALRRVGVNWDITDAREAEQTHQKTLLAQRESQAKSQFMSRLSHELRTPLNAVLGFTQLLQAEARHAAPDGWLDKLGHVRAAGEHLLALIDDVLDLSSLETGALRLNCEPISLAATVAQALPIVQAVAAKRGVRLRAGVLAGTAMADPARLRQVLHNLLTHAIGCNRAPGEVVVESQRHGERVQLQVHDAGSGLRCDAPGRWFEPFSQAGAERPGSVGSGIGLAIARALVEGMGGTLTAFSDAGRGSVFEVTLAAAPEAQAPSPGEQANVPAASTSIAADTRNLQRRGQLLYIEDNEVNVLLVEALVRSVPGLRIACEGTGAQGVERAGRLQPDLILVDLQLPDFDGFEVLRRLRAQPQTATTPCIALSANAMAEDIARGLAAGFDDYWTKPIRFKPFLEALERRFPARAA